MLSNTAIEPGTRDAVRRFVEIASRDFPIAEAILFGSRARGDHGPESDADLAVVLRDASSGEITAAGSAMADIAFDVLLETGVLISPLPLTGADMTQPTTFGRRALVEAIRTEGVML